MTATLFEENLIVIEYYMFCFVCCCCRTVVTVWSIRVYFVWHLLWQITPISRVTTNIVRAAQRFAQYSVLIVLNKKAKQRVIQYDCRVIKSTVSFFQPNRSEHRCVLYETCTIQCNGRAREMLRRIEEAQTWEKRKTEYHCSDISVSYWVYGVQEKSCAIRYMIH